MPDLLVRNSALHYGTHPLTGEPMGPADKTCAEASGAVRRVVQDRTGQIIFEYEDGHLFVIHVEGLALVTAIYRPQGEGVH